ncbi:phosphocholine cytidylyltransferase family protein [Candidatus Peregrinibacteria bacterium]|jgi:L-glutamine-phosphate cytidylyltransferase|nr:phosphocholine cytidylyltransferase family protein [Candidatus Peregrinibacteria bacterium]
MKVAFLLAGMSRRMGELTKDKPKSLVELSGAPLLGHLLERFVANGITDFVPVIGYKKEGILDFIKEKYGGQVTVTPAVNEKYNETNNMYSLYCAASLLRGKPFILCNGDTLLNKNIIKSLNELPEAESAIALDIENKDIYIDSPGTIIKDGRVFDIGRHVSAEENGGYAIGLYKFNAELSEAFFTEIEKMLEKGQYNAGFHDPLMTLFAKYPMSAHSTAGLSWTDLDTPEDIPKIEAVLSQIISEEN